MAEDHLSDQRGNCLAGADETLGQQACDELVKHKGGDWSASAHRATARAVVCYERCASVGSDPMPEAARSAVARGVAAWRAAAVALMASSTEAARPMSDW